MNVILVLRNEINRNHWMLEIEIMEMIILILIKLKLIHDIIIIVKVELIKWIFSLNDIMIMGGILLIILVVINWFQVNDLFNDRIHWWNGNIFNLIQIIKNKKEELFFRNIRLLETINIIIISEVSVWNK
ncbi:MAG: hypothetical protein H9Q65_02815 [Spiroplasma ixodetis]|nr:hypothetical protein [Spiroplasma ixodetis]